MAMASLDRQAEIDAAHRASAVTVQAFLPGAQPSAPSRSCFAGVPARRPRGRDATARVGEPGRVHGDGLPVGGFGAERNGVGRVAFGSPSFPSDQSADQPAAVAVAAAAIPTLFAAPESPAPKARSRRLSRRGANS